MPTWPYPRLIAHRGAGKLAPENTLPAIEEGFRRGYRCVEIDVGLTADGVVALLHDAALLRTTGDPRLLAETPSADLATLDAGAWLHPRFAGTRIPTLALVLTRCRKLGMQIFIELKVGRGQDAQRLGAAVAQTIAMSWSGPPPLLISFNAAALAAVGAADSMLPRALLLGHECPVDWAAQLAGCGACALDLDHRSITLERVVQVHAAGYALLAWTVNEPARAAELLRWGVDGVTTDVVDRIMPDGSAAE
ncbi:MAG: glycerophosphodiester phosphodiesterase family protein [Planctomycetota bacterium]